MNEKLKSIVEKAGTDLLALAKEGEKHILDAWNACQDEANENDSTPKFKLALGITLDLDKNSMETALSFGVKHKLVANCQIPDPNQSSLPIEDEGTVTIETGGKTFGPVSSSEFSRIAKKIAKSAGKK